MASREDDDMPTQTAAVVSKVAAVNKIIKQGFIETVIPDVLALKQMVSVVLFQW